MLNAKNQFLPNQNGEEQEWHRYSEEKPPMVMSQTPRARHQEPDAKSRSQEPDAKSQTPRVRSQEPEVKSQTPRPRRQEPDTKNHMPRARCQSYMANLRKAKFKWDIPGINT